MFGFKEWVNSAQTLLVNFYFWTLPLASTSALINAVLTSSNTPTDSTKDLDIAVSTSAKIALDYDGGNVNIVSVGTSGTVQLKASSITKVDVGTSASAKLQLEAAPTAGSATTSGSVIVSVPNGCDGLTLNTGGSCTVDESYAVVVGIERTLTRSGTETCPISNQANTPQSSGVQTHVSLLSLLVAIMIVPVSII